MIFIWFSDNQLKGNWCSWISNFANHEDESCHKRQFSSNASAILEKLLGGHHPRLTCSEEHIKLLSRKAGSIISALSRITPFFKIDKRKLLMNTFFQSQFNRCSFVRTLHSHKINNKIPGHIKYASVLLTRTTKLHLKNILRWITAYWLILKI